MALWAVGRAATEGKTWVGRGCNFPELVTYNESQGFTLVHEVQRPYHRFYLMARRAEPIADLRRAFRELLAADAHGKAGFEGMR
ncbi:hypothetical protein AB0A70_01090 [Streptomyces morookaense]|uniref:hypothetical protein n=1 Tax=Streptomyces morookaense TaxID=1970 RepID=UPI0033C28571